MDYLSNLIFQITTDNAESIGMIHGIKLSREYVEAHKLKSVLSHVDMDELDSLTNENLAEDIARLEGKIYDIQILINDLQLLKTRMQIILENNLLNE